MSGRPSCRSESASCRVLSVEQSEGLGIEDQHIGRVRGQQGGGLFPLRGLLQATAGRCQHRRYLPQPPRSRLTSKIVDVGAFIYPWLPSRAPSEQDPDIVQPDGSNSTHPRNRSGAGTPSFW